jgi:hypothetical protein
MLALMRIGCMSENEADGLGWILEEKTPSAKELRGLIIELEDRALSCDKVSYDQALAVVKILREAWKEVRGYE